MHPSGRLSGLTDYLQKTVRSRKKPLFYLYSIYIRHDGYTPETLMLVKN
jgi:hypothetical protein